MINFKIVDLTAFHATIGVAPLKLITFPMLF